MFIHTALGLFSSTKQELINESEKHEIQMSTHSFFLLSISTSYLFYWPHRRYSAIMASSVSYCASNMTRFDFVCDLTALLRLRQNRWSSFTPRAWPFIHPGEEWRVLLDDCLPRPTPQRSTVKRNVAFLPRIDRSSCPRSEIRSPCNAIQMSVLQIWVVYLQQRHVSVKDAYIFFFFFNFKRRDCCLYA